MNYNVDDHVKNQKSENNYDEYANENSDINNNYYCLESKGKMKKDSNQSQSLIVTLDHNLNE